MKNWRLAASLLFVAGIVGACPKGTEPWEGGCASMPSPQESTLAPMIPTSNEAVPKDKMPSYEREGIHADTRDSEIANDIKHDNQIKCAAIKGKKGAKIKLTQEDEDFSEAVCKNLK